MRDDLDGAIERGDWAAVGRHAADMVEGTGTFGTDTDTDSPGNVDRYLTASATFGTDSPGNIDRYLTASATFGTESPENVDGGVNREYLTASEGEEDRSVEGTSSVDGDRIALLERLIEARDWQSVAETAAGGSGGRTSRRPLLVRMESRTTLPGGREGREDDGNGDDGGYGSSSDAYSSAEEGEIEDELFEFPHTALEEEDESGAFDEGGRAGAGLPYGPYETETDDDDDAGGDGGDGTLTPRNPDGGATGTEEEASTTAGARIAADWAISRSYASMGDTPGGGTRSSSSSGGGGERGDGYDGDGNVVVVVTDDDDTRDGKSGTHASPSAEV